MESLVLECLSPLGMEAMIEAAKLQAVVHWKGGEETTVEVAKGKSGVHRYVSPPELVELIGTLAKEFSDAQIARILHRKRLKTPKGRSFEAYHVANVRNKHGIRPGPIVPVQGDDVYTAEKAGKLLEVDRGTVIRLSWTSDCSRAGK